MGTIRALLMSMGIVSNMCVGGGKGHDNFSFSINPRWGGGLFKIVVAEGGVYVLKMMQ